MELAAILTLINIGLACWNIWKEVRPRRTPQPRHPLEDPLRDIAHAIRGQATPPPLDVRGRSF